MSLTFTLSKEVGYVFAVAIFYVLEILAFGVVVGRKRTKFNVKYPDVTGPPEFNRAMRVHYNAIEGAPLFFVLLFIGTLYSAYVSAIAGVIYIVGRTLYAAGYIQAVEKRGPGAAIFHIGELILLVESIMLTYNLITSGSY
jgi:glutathione S-transferase